MEEKKKIGDRKLLLIAIVLILVVIIGTTYAWYRITRSSDAINKIKAGSLEMTLDDTATEGIKLLNEVPRSYRQGMETTEYTFTLTNKNSTSSYSLSLKDLAKYINDENEEVTVADENRIADSKIRYILLKNGEEATADKSKILTDRVIDTGTIEKGQTIKYSLRVWIDSRAETDIMGKIFNAQLNIEATQYVQPTKTALCKRATTLHTEECTQTDSSRYCSGDGYALNDTITYGNLGTTGTLTSGDAFDCDVNGDGVYDSTTERFYYVSDMTNGITTDANTAVLIYYNNVSVGAPSSSASCAYSDTQNFSFDGPVSLLSQLPTTGQWKNVSLTNTTRMLTNVKGENTLSNGQNFPTAFSYEGYAARFITAQEVSTGCGFTVGSYTKGELSVKCKYLMENTVYSSGYLRTYGEWLESPDSSDSWLVDAGGRYVITNQSYYSNAGARPAIEVSKINIDY